MEKRTDGRETKEKSVKEDEDGADNVGRRSESETGKTLCETGNNQLSDVSTAQKDCRHFEQFDCVFGVEYLWLKQTVELLVKVRNVPFVWLFVG